MSEKKYKVNDLGLPNINNPALLAALSGGGLQFGNGEKFDPSKVIAQTTVPVQPVASKDQPVDTSGSREILSGTFRDLLPALFGLGAGIVGRKAGLKPNDALGLGVTTLNAATSVQDTYRNNRQKYYNRVASKLVDKYVAESGGKIDANMIYKKLEDEAPDVFKNINTGDFIASKMAERNKVIDLSQKEYQSDYQKKADYEGQKSMSFMSGGELISPDPTVGPNISYRNNNYTTMINHLKERYDKKYKRDGSDGKIVFDNKEDYDDFVSYMKDLKEETPDGQYQTYDMTQVLKWIKPPEVDTKSAKIQSEIEKNKALTELAKVRAKTASERTTSKRGGSGSGQNDTILDYRKHVATAYVIDSPIVAGKLAELMYKKDTQQITDEELANEAIKLSGEIKDSQSRENWLMEMLTGKSNDNNKKTGVKLPELD